MLVSHDQDFIDNTCTEIFSLDRGRLKSYKGNYESYMMQKKAENEEREKNYLRQKEERERTEAFIERFRYKATKAKQVQSRIKQLEKMDEYNLGWLIYFLEKACGISGYVLGVNPFDQPGVESYKLNMFALMGKPGYEERRAELEKRINF